MKNLFILILATLTFIMNSCQKDDFTNVENRDQTITTSDTISNEIIFRLYPTNVKERSSNSIYIDFEPIGRQVTFYIESETMSAERIATNYNIQIFVAEKCNWLRIAFNDIETASSNGDLYYYGDYPSNPYCMYWGGVQAKYSKKQIKPTVYQLSIDKIINEPASGFGFVLILPTRIKMSHKNGGPTYIFDTVMHCEIVSGSPTIWFFTEPYI